MRVKVFCDGSSTGGWGPGGWGIVMCFEDGTTVEACGGEEDTTNQRQELTAVCEALERVEPGSHVMIVCDAAYVVNCIRQQWYVKWRANGWRNSHKDPVANRDLWERLLEAVKRPAGIYWKKVKGHQKGVGKYKNGNDRADELAVAAKKKIQQQMEERKVG